MATSVANVYGEQIGTISQQILRVGSNIRNSLKKHKVTIIVM